MYPSSVSWKIIPLYFFNSSNIYFAQKELIKMNIFETFKCLDQILSNSLCQFWNNSISLQIFYPSSVSWKIIPLYFFSSNNLYFGHKEPIKTKNILRLSSARVKFCQIPYANFERTTRFLSKFCIPLQFHERLFLCTFLAQTIYTLLKSSPLKWFFFRLSSAWVKFCQIPDANFEMMSQYLSKFCIPLQFHERLFLCTF